MEKILCNVDKVCECSKRFQDNCENVERDERPGCSSTTTINENREKCDRNEHDRSTNHNRRNHMKRMSTKFVLKLLFFEKKITSANRSGSRVTKRSQR